MAMIKIRYVGPHKRISAQYRNERITMHQGDAVSVSDIFASRLVEPGVIELVTNKPKKSAKGAENGSD